jgi:ATP-dependent Clp protease ATP-binding subunit ClpA
VNKELIDDVLALTCNVPKQRVEQADTQQLAVLETHLSNQVFGQSEAIREVSNAIKFSRAGLNEENKPVASFLFVGPTGVGKTETAKSLAQEMGIHFTRFDMSEYTEKHAVAKLIGSPAGYVGYEDGGLLTEEVRKHPYSVLLLDEIEKAHPDIYNILLQVMDYATLTDNRGRKADFRNIILIMTSNAGADAVGKNVIGFGSSRLDDTAIHEAVKNTFQPEFRNRLSKIVLFHSMDADMARHITEKKLSSLKKQMLAKKIELTISEEALEYVKNKGITNEYGAREIDRVIASSVKPLLVEQILFGKLKKGGKCRIELDRKQAKREDTLILKL